MLTLTVRCFPLPHDDLLVMTLRTLLLVSLLAVPCFGSTVTLQWDANTEADLDGYRLFVSTKTLLSMPTQQAMITDAIKKSTTTATTFTPLLAANTTYYFRLTAFDKTGNQSGFNVDYSSNPYQVIKFVKKGDINNDDKVDGFDYIQFLVDWTTYNPRSDFDNNGKIDGVDYVMLLDGWGK